MQSTDAQSVDAALGQLVKGVYLIALSDAEGRALTPGTALINFSRDPHTLLWSVEQSSSLFPRLQPGTRVAVNVLAADQADLLQHCATSKGEERFGCGTWRGGDATQAPWLPEAQAVLQCRVAEVWQHRAQAAVVLAVDAASAAPVSNPMCYAGGRFGAFRPSS